MFKTCCALHNNLLFFDGLLNIYSSAQIESDYITNFGYKTITVFHDCASPVSRIQKYCNNGDIETEEIINLCDKFDEFSFTSYMVNGLGSVKIMSLRLFRECLVENFDILFRQNTFI